MKEMREQILGAQQDGMRLGIKFGAQSLRDIADECAKDSNIAADYVRGLRDAAALIERLAVDLASVIIEPQP